MTEVPLPPALLAERLAEVYVLVGPLYRRALRKAELGESIEGVSAGVRAVLDLLRQGGPMTVPQMGRAQALSREFVQRMVDDAAARGLVEAVPGPAHRRSRPIRLTDAGHEAITAVTAREHALLGQVGGDLTGADIDACVKVLSRLLEQLSDVEVD